MCKQLLLYVLFLLTITGNPALAQIPIISGDSIVLVEQAMKKVGKGANFTVIPGPVYNTTQKLGFAVLPVLVYDLNAADTISPPSSSGLLIYYNFSKSWMLAAKQNFYWGSDKWRSGMGAGYGQFEQKFFGLGRDTAIVSNNESHYTWINLDIFEANINLYRKIIYHYFLGLQYDYLRSNLEGTDSLSSAMLIEQGIEPGFQSESCVIPSMIWDSRDNIYWSARGYYAGLNMQLANRAILSDYSYTVIAGFVNGYHRLLKQSNRLTLAWHFYFQSGWGDIPFTRLANYSRGDEATGYTAGKYVNNSEVSVQAEIRYDVWKFIAAGGYAGTGKVYHELNNFGHSVWLPFGGIRLYVNVMPSRNLRLRFDMAFARKDFGVYVGVGQAF